MAYWYDGTALAATRSHVIALFWCLIKFTTTTTTTSLLRGDMETSGTSLLRGDSETSATSLIHGDKETSATSLLHGDKETSATSLFHGCGCCDNWCWCCLLVDFLLPYFFRHGEKLHRVLMERSHECENVILVQLLQFNEGFLS